MNGSSDEITVWVENRSGLVHQLNAGEPIAQLMMMNFYTEAQINLDFEGPNADDRDSDLIDLNFCCSSSEASSPSDGIHCREPHPSREMSRESDIDVSK